ncbi:hypothetical protein TruAng_008516 [Truncatella angustata]|nr:hypothetical protein TruAng_008516 [Truncatella angustata]
MFPPRSAGVGVLALVSTAIAALPRLGNITLFSDTACTDAVFVNNFIVGRDFCAPADNSGSGTGSVFQSYILNERPFCDDGWRPLFNVYGDLACADLIASYEPGPLYDPPGPDADGTCVAPGGEYKAVAFICDDFEGTGPGVSGTLPSPSTSATRTLSSVTQTTSEERPSSLTTTGSATESASSQSTVTGEQPSSTAAFSRSQVTGSATTTSRATNLLTATNVIPTAPTAALTAGAALASPGLVVIIGGLFPAVILAI